MFAGFKKAETPPSLQCLTRTLSRGPSVPFPKTTCPTGSYPECCMARRLSELHNTDNRPRLFSLKLTPTCEQEPSMTYILLTYPLPALFLFPIAPRSTNALIKPSTTWTPFLTSSSSTPSGTCKNSTGPPTCTSSFPSSPRSPSFASLPPISRLRLQNCNSEV